MKKILLLLANGFESYEASVFIDVLAWNLLEGDGTTKLVTCGLRDRLTCTGNLTVLPELLASEVNVTDFDALAIPGGFEEFGFYEDAYSNEFLSIVQRFNQSKKNHCLDLRRGLTSRKEWNFIRTQRHDLSFKQ